MSRTILDVFVRGGPKAQPRVKPYARQFEKDGKLIARAGVYTPGTASDWKSLVRHAIRELPWDGPLPRCEQHDPVRIVLRYRFLRPRSHFGSGRNAAVLKPSAPRWHVSKPDLDNLNKAIYDTLTQMGVFWDDSQVCREVNAKDWTCRFEEAGVRIVVKVLR